MVRGSSERGGRPVWAAPEAIKAFPLGRGRLTESGRDEKLDSGRCWGNIDKSPVLNEPCNMRFVCDNTPLEKPAFRRSARLKPQLRRSLTPTPPRRSSAGE